MHNEWRVVRLTISIALILGLSLISLGCDQVSSFVSGSDDALIGCLLENDVDIDDLWPGDEPCALESLEWFNDNSDTDVLTATFGGDPELTEAFLKLEQKYNEKKAERDAEAQKEQEALEKKVEESLDTIVEDYSPDEPTPTSIQNQTASEEYDLLSSKILEHIGTRPTVDVWQIPDDGYMSYHTFQEGSDEVISHTEIDELIPLAGYTLFMDSWNWELPGTLEALKNVSIRNSDVTPVVHTFPQHDEVAYTYHIYPYKCDLPYRREISTSELQEFLSKGGMEIPLEILERISSCNESLYHTVRMDKEEKPVASHSLSPEMQDIVFRGGYTRTTLYSHSLPTVDTSRISLMIELLASPPQDVIETQFHFGQYGGNRWNEKLHKWVPDCARPKDTYRLSEKYDVIRSTFPHAASHGAWEDGLFFLYTNVGPLYRASYSLADFPNSCAWNATFTRVEDDTHVLAAR